MLLRPTLSNQTYDQLYTIMDEWIESKPTGQKALMGKRWPVDHLRLSRTAPCVCQKVEM